MIQTDMHEEMNQTIHLPFFSLFQSVLREVGVKITDVKPNLRVCQSVRLISYKISIYLIVVINSSMVPTPIDVNDFVMPIFS